MGFDDFDLTRRAFESRTLRPALSEALTGCVVDAAPFREDLQGAVDAACQGGGLVYLPPLEHPADSYIVREPPLRITRPNIAIVGGGLESRIRFPALSRTPRAGVDGRAGVPLVEVAARGADGASVRLENLWLDMSADPAMRRLPLVGLRVAPVNTADLLLRDVSIGPDSTAALPDSTGVRVQAPATRLVLDGVKIMRCGALGVEAALDDANSPASLEIRDSVITNCGAGVLARNLERLAVLFTALQVQERYGVFVERTRHVTLGGCRFEGNWNERKASIPSLEATPPSTELGTARRPPGLLLQPGQAQISIGGGCRLVSIHGCYITGNDWAPHGVAVFTENGLVSIVGNTLDRHPSHDVYLALEAGTLFPDPTADDGELRLPLNSKFRGDRPDRPSVVRARTATPFDLRGVDGILRGALPATRGGAG